MTSRRSGRHPDADAVVVRLIKPASDDLEALARLDPQIARWAIKKMLLLERNPEAGEGLHGALSGWRKITVSNRDWRIVWRVTHDESGRVIVDVAEVWAVGARADSEIYEEMRSRAAALPPSPDTEALSDVIARLGKVAAGLSATPEPTGGEPLPDWLVDRLTRQVGLSADKVDGMSLQQAVDTWTEWISRR